MKQSNCFMLDRTKHLLLLLREIMVTVTNITEGNGAIESPTFLSDPCDMRNNGSWIALILQFEESTKQGREIIIGDGTNGQYNCEIINRELQPNEKYSVQIWIKNTFEGKIRYSKYPILNVNEVNDVNIPLYILGAIILMGILMIIYYRYVPTY